MSDEIRWEDLRPIIWPPGMTFGDAQRRGLLRYEDLPRFSDVLPESHDGSQADDPPKP